MTKPNFFIIGAAKCGTTTLYEYLNAHPQVFMSSVKEPHFFSDIESANPFDYLAPVAGEKYHNKIIRDEKIYMNLFQKSDNFPVRGEASVSYLLDLNAAERIYNFNPDAKIIAILRDPVQRAFSHFKANRMIGSAYYPDDFYKEITTDWNIKGKKWGLKGRLYIELGFYTQQLARYAKVFPKENMLVIGLPELQNHPELTMKKVYSFLSIDEHPLVEDQNKVYNESKQMKSSLLLKLKKIKDKNIFLSKLSRKIPAIIKVKIYDDKIDKINIDDKSLSFLRKIYKDESRIIFETYGVEI